MKMVQISERDRAILKACAMSSVIGKASVADMQALYNANTKIDTSTAPTDIDTCSDEAKRYDLEDAEVAALKALFADARGNLRRSQEVLKGALDCHAHLEDAKDIPVQDKKD